MRTKLAVVFMVLLLLLISACSSSGGSTDIQQTQVAIWVEQTVIARDIAALTQAANQPQLPQQFPSPIVNSPGAPPTIESSSSSNLSNFDDWLANSKILLYEDVAGTGDRTRWIADALDDLGLSYFDSVDQIGLFQSKLSSNDEWDLIIYARENRNNDSGNLFAEIFDEYDNAGSSVIIEHWNLDDVANFSSALTAKMSRCGFTITADWYDSTGSGDLLLYAHNTQNPIHNQPNSSIRLTSFNTVRWTGELGDFLRVVPGGEGQILYGASENNPSSKGTVIACFDNRFILQTHATHQYERDRMIYLWENYIYNALEARYRYLGK